MMTQQEEIAAGRAVSPATWPLISNISFYVKNTLESWGVDCSDWVGEAVGGGNGGAGGVGGGGPDVAKVLDLLLDVRQEVCVCVRVCVLECAKARESARARESAYDGQPRALL